VATTEIPGEPFYLRSDLKTAMAFPLLLVQTPPPVPAMQQSQPSPTAILERLFTAPTVEADWFDSSFLTAAPLPEIQKLVGDLRQSLGPLKQVEAQPNFYQIDFEKGTVQAQIVLNAQGKITGLLLQPRPQGIAVEEAIAQLKTFPGQVNLLVQKNGQDLAALDADTPLGVGSAFKLAVLAALQQQIKQGDRTWTEVIRLQEANKSLPSGILQDWYDGAPLTLESLATLMISISDNTATDAIIHHLGRNTIEPFSPHTQPFLTTRDFFTLKDSANVDLLKRYRDGNEGDRRQVLQELQTRPLPSANLFDGGNPLAIDVEWLFTPRELCSLMGEVADLSLMQVNDGGLADATQWSTVSFKGGSEPGVMNLTTQLQAEDGTTYCVSATWNNPDAALDEQKLFMLYSSITAGLN
jgi:beta-lactamase class A